MLGLVGSVGGSVKSFQVAFELPSVREDDLYRLWWMEIFTDYEFHSLVRVVITGPRLERLSVVGD